MFHLPSRLLLDLWWLVLLLYYIILYFIAKNTARATSRLITEMTSTTIAVVFDPLASPSVSVVQRTNTWECYKVHEQEGAKVKLWQQSQNCWENHELQLSESNKQYANFEAQTNRSLLRFWFLSFRGITDLWSQQHYSFYVHLCTLHIHYMFMITYINSMPFQGWLMKWLICKINIKYKIRL